MSDGFIKLHRSLVEWEWWDDHNAVRLLTYLLVSVNWKDKKWKGQTVNAGSLITSWDNLSKSVGLSKQQIRTAMTKLEECGEVTRKSTNKWQAVTLAKWDKLQISSDEVTHKPTGKQQADSTQITPTKESKEYKERKNNILMSEAKASDLSEGNFEFYDIAVAFYRLFEHNEQVLDVKWNDLKKVTANKFTDQIRLMIKSDGRTIEDLQCVFRFLKNDSFWMQNIRSSKKLREKFDQLITKSKNNVTGNKFTPNISEELRNEIINNPNI